MKEESRLVLEGFLQFGNKWDTVVNHVKANCQMFDNEHAAFLAYNCICVTKNGEHKTMWGNYVITEGVWTMIGSMNSSH